MATQPSNQELQEQMDALRKDFSDLTGTLKEMSASYAKDGQARVKDAAEEAQKQVKDSLGRAQSEVEQHPFSSMAVAFGIGLLLGKLLDR